MLLDVLCNMVKKIHEKNESAVTIIGIDGGGGSGKTTLASKIAAQFTNISIVHMDDFYKEKKYRTVDELCKAPSGYDYDIERLIAMVINPLRLNNVAIFQQYNWGENRLDKTQEIMPGGIIIIEGCYSLINQLRDFYDLTIFVDTNRDTRLKRGLERDGLSALPFWRNWMAGEDKYFKEQLVKDTADIVFIGDEKL